MFKRVRTHGTVYYAGNLKLFDDFNLSMKSVKKYAADIQNQGKTVVIIGTKQRVMGIIAVSDTIRHDTIDALDALKQAGVNQLAMLTGDNEGTAKMIAKEANVNRYFSELFITSG
jgi:Cd2+/Zn2+-exporting ATPase